MECSACGQSIQAATAACPVCQALLASPDAGTVASPLRRLAGHLMDGLIWSAIGFASTLFLAAGNGAGVELGMGTVAIFGSLALLLYAWAHSTSPGKWVMGMYVYRTSGQKAGLLIMVLRETIGKFISGLILGLGYLWILFDRTNQGWHDKLVSTVVLKAVR